MPGNMSREELAEQKAEMEKALKFYEKTKTDEPLIKEPLIVDVRYKEELEQMKAMQQEEIIIRIEKKDTGLPVREVYKRDIPESRSSELMKNLLFKLELERWNANWTRFMGCINAIRERCCISFNDEQLRVIFEKQFGLEPKE